MRHSLTLTTLTAAALLLAGCSGETDQEALQPEITPIQEPTPEVRIAAESDEWPLEPNPDGHEIHLMFQWVPSIEDRQPVGANYTIWSSEADSEVAYSSGLGSDDTMPSMDTESWEKFIYELPDGGYASANVSLSNPPTDGYFGCLVVEVKQEVVLDYQEVSADDSLACYGFTDGDHDYEPGIPPIDVQF